jgi:hypothetical protein
MEEIRIPEHLLVNITCNAKKILIYFWYNYSCHLILLFQFTYVTENLEGLSNLVTPNLLYRGESNLFSDKPSIRRRISFLHKMIYLILN